MVTSGFRFLGRPITKQYNVSLDNVYSAVIMAETLYCNSSHGSRDEYSTAPILNSQQATS